MEYPKINNEPTRNIRRQEAQEKRKRRDRIAIGTLAIGVPIAALGISVFNSEPVDDSPRPTDDQQSTFIEQESETGDVENIVDPDSIRTVNFEQQQDGSFTAVSEIEDSGSDTEI